MVITVSSTTVGHTSFNLVLLLYLSILSFSTKPRRTTSQDIMCLVVPMSVTCGRTCFGCHVTSEIMPWPNRSRFLDAGSGAFSKPFHCCVSAAGEGGEDGIERTCDTLLMCIVTVLNQGLRNGGGVGDVLRRPSKDVSKTEGVCFRSQVLLSFFPSLCFPLLTFLHSFPLSLPPLSPPFLYWGLNLSLRRTPSPLFTL